MRSGVVQPSEALNFWRQASALTAASLKCRYRKTVAGFLWVFLNPLITFAVQAVAFGHILKIDVAHYLLFLVSGLIPWMFVAQTLEMSSGVFVNSGSLIKSIAVSPMVYLLAQVLDNFVNFVAAFVLILTIGGLIEGGANWAWGMGILPMIPLVAGVYALSWLLATAQVFFRDTKFVVGFGLQACFFLTPIFYPREFAPASLQWLIDVNPFFRMIHPFQVLLHDFSPATFWPALFSSAVTAAILMFGAVMAWRARRHSVYLYV